jgi:aromatic-L-amino-acid decarboxylase
MKKVQIPPDLAELEHLSRQLDPDDQTRYRWTRATIERAEAYRQKLKTDPISVRSENPGAELLAHPPGEEGMEIEEALSLFARNVENEGLKPASGGYMAYIPGGGLYPGALGDFLAAAGNFYSGVYYGSPGAVRMENLLIRWTAELLGYDPELAGGNLTSGGSYAGLIGLHVAREVKQLKAREVEKAVIYLSSQTHHATSKALKVVGLGEANIRQVPLDDDFRMQPQALAKMIKEDLKQGRKPFLLVGSLGTTDVGAVDPLEELADICQEYQLWFHVDAAYGGFFALDPACAPLFKGLGRADSIVIDPHKSLFLAYGSGMVLLKNRQHLYDTYRSSASYMQDTEIGASEYSPADLSPELSKHFRGLRMWLPLKLHGLAPFRAALQEKRLLTHWFYRQLVQHPRFEVPLVPQLTVVLFRYLPPSGEINAFNQQLAQRIQQDGRVFLSTTSIEGAYYLRLAILHYKTHFEEVERVFRLLNQHTSELENALIQHPKS